MNDLSLFLFVLWLLYINLRATNFSPQPEYTHIPQPIRPRISTEINPPSPKSQTNTTTLLPLGPSAGTDVIDMSSAAAMAATSAHHLEHDEQQLQHQQHQRIGSVTSAGDIVADDGSATVMGTPGVMGTLRRGPSKHYLSGTCVPTPTDPPPFSSPKRTHIRRTQSPHNVIPEICGLRVVCKLEIFAFSPSLDFRFCSR